MKLIEETPRARYWKTSGGLYRATKPGEPAPPENGGGYVLLQTLKNLKGDT